MRPALLLAALALVPLAVADTQQGATVGVNLGYVQPGMWDVYSLDHAGGAVSLSLTWARSLFPGADYDLHLYRPHAADDGTLTPDERLADSSRRTFAEHMESVNATLAPGRYYAAIVPFQTQAEVYTLSSSVGDLQFQATTPGFMATCPPFPC